MPGLASAAILTAIGFILMIGGALIGDEPMAIAGTVVCLAGFALATSLPGLYRWDEERQSRKLMQQRREYAARRRNLKA